MTAVRTLFCLGALAVLVTGGCAKHIEESGGSPRSGDVLRPRLHVPEAWIAGRTTAFGAHVVVSRPDRPESFDLKDDCVPEGSVRVTATLTFFAGDTPLGDPRILLLAHEC
jgi:hypothetical protein